MAIGQSEVMKKQTKIVTLVASTIVVAGVFGFVVDRPVLYRGEFLPIAEEVIELTVENTWNKWQRASEQVERREAKIQYAVEAVSAEEREELLFWKKRLFELERKLKKLDR